MSALQCDPLHGEFGASVRGVNLSEPMTDDVVEEIREAIDTYSFLCFPEQSMTDDDLVAFTKLLGEPEIEHVTYGRTGKKTYVSTIGNIADDGTQKGNDHFDTKYQKGNNLWHSDSSFREMPSFVTITHAHEVPGEGGATEFVSARAAYEGLAETKQAEIANLKVVHDYVFSRSQVAPVDPNHAASLPPVTHNLVKENPRNGRKNYYVGSHARCVLGYGGVEARALIDELMAHATGAEHIYAHQWQAGDTVIWDNRCLLHRGTPFDADKWRRRMRQTRVVGNEPGLIPS